MKRTFLLLTALALLFTFAACRQTQEPETTSDLPDQPDLAALADSIVETYALSGGLRYSSSSTIEGEYLDDDLIRSYYGDVLSAPSFEDVEAYEVYIDESNPTQPCEFGIFQMRDGADTELFLSFLRARIDQKINNAIAYPTMDTEALTTAKIAQSGAYLWYCAVKGANAEIDQILSDALSR